MPTAEYDRAGYRRNAALPVPWICAVPLYGNYCSPCAARIDREDKRAIEQPVYDIDG